MLFVLILGVFIGAFIFFYEGVDRNDSMPDIGNLFPFGSDSRDVGGVPGLEDDAASSDTRTPTTETIQALRQLYAKPTVGVIVFNREEDPAVRFIERETGHVFESDLSNNAPARVTNTTISRIQEAVWLNSDDVAIQYLTDENDVVETFVGTIESPPENVDETVTETALAGIFLPRGIESIAAKVPSETLFYVRSEEGSAIFDTETNETNPLGLAVIEWLPQWVLENNIVVTTKPSASAFGFSYIFTIENERLERVLGTIAGLTTNANASLDRILYSESTGGSITLHVLDRTENIATPLPVRTLPEKCIWSNTEEATVYCGVPTNLPRAAYPDAWYQGTLSFSDDIWEIDSETGTTERLIQLEDVSRSAIDAIDLALTPDERFLIFRNKRDGTLWSLTLPQEEPVDTNEQVE